MKKLLLFLVFPLFLISCEDSTPQPLDTKQILDLEVKAGDWKEYVDNTGLNRYYSYHFKTNEITSSVYNNGVVVAYIEIDGKQQTLPCVRHYQNDKGALWTRTTDFDYATGGITFYVTSSDFAVDPPETMRFRVVLMW